MANLKSLFTKLLQRQSPTDTSASQPQTSSLTSSAISRPRRVTPSPPPSLDPLAIVGDLDTQPSMPALPQFKPHEKHGVLDRIIAGLKGGQRAGLGGMIEGARSPEVIEEQDWQRNTLAPAFAERQMLSKEADAQAERKIKLGQLLGQLINANANKTKAEADAAQPFDKGEFLLYRDPTTGEMTPLLGPDSKPIRHSTVATATVNQEGQLLTQQERNKGLMAVEDERTKRTTATEKERTGRARYVADTNASSRIGAAKISAGARIGAAQIGATTRTNKQAVPKFFDDDDIADLAANEMKGKTADEIRHALEMRGLKFKPKPQS